MNSSTSPSFNRSNNQVFKSPSPINEALDSLPVSVQISRFIGASGVEELHWIIKPTQYAHFDTQLKWIEQAYTQAVEKLGLTMNSTVWRRFLCSDLINQADALRKHSFSNPASQAPENSPCAVSWVGQVPAPPSKVTLWAHHIIDPDQPLHKSLTGHTLSLQRRALTHHYSTGLTHTPSDSSTNTSHTQTLGIFKKYTQFLESQKMNLADNVIRTWFFVSHVDSNYAGLVEARNEVFDREGLTAQTHTIASTGIEGVFTSPKTNTLLDAYAISGVQPEQICYLKAAKHLSSTHLYGVAFERATSVSYRDRSHIFISGTASIDDQGATLHLGDVIKQLNRTLINIEALLKEAQATLDNIKIFIIYLRDPNDHAIISEKISQQFPHTPFEIVTAPVCRPSWLIEIEGIAITENNHPELPSF